MNSCYSDQLESSYILAIILGYLAAASPFIFALERGDIFSRKKHHNLAGLYFLYKNQERSCH